jgi:hypothetical protein
LPRIIVVAVSLQISINKLQGRRSKAHSETAHFFFAERLPDLAAAISAGCAIDFGPNALCGFPFLPVYFFLVEFALEFDKLAESPVLLFLSLCKRTDLNEIDGHTYKMALAAAECKPGFGPRFPHALNTCFVYESI